MNHVSLLWKLYQQIRNTRKTRGQIAALQNQRLRKLLRYAYAHSAYYHRTFEEAGITAARIDSAPIDQFPVIDKQQLMEHFDQLVTENDLTQAGLLQYDKSGSDALYLGKYHVVHSSGSTGIPRYFVYDEQAWNQMLPGIVRGALWGMSMPAILKLLAGRPRILYIAATNGRYGGSMAVGDGIKGVGAEQRFLDIDTPLGRWAETVEAFKPDILIGYPSAMKILAELLKTENTALSIKRVISCGEPLGPELRKFLESTFHAPVMNFYGASESLALGVEPNAADGMFLFDDLNLVEIKDGEMYITCLYNFAQPLIRYHITDQLLPRKYSASHPFSRSDVLLCRNEDVLWFEPANGRREYLHPLSIEGFCLNGLLDYQFQQTEKAAFEMLAQVANPDARGAVEQKMRCMMGQILRNNGLEQVTFSIRFVDRILPNPKTGKKALVINSMEASA